MNLVKAMMFFNGKGYLVKRTLIFLVFFGIAQSVQACSLGGLLHFLTCNIFRSAPSEERLLRKIEHRLCYERGVAALLNPIYDFLKVRRQQDPLTRCAVVFDLDGVTFYEGSNACINAVLDFYRKVYALGFDIIFLSSRPASDLRIIDEDLRAAGYFGGYSLNLLPDDLARDFSCRCHEEVMHLVAKWKESKRVFFEQSLGVKIIATLDDSPLCLVGEACGMPIWIPRYQELLVKYHELSAKNLAYISQYRQ